MNIGGKNQADCFLGDKGGSFSPDCDWKNEGQKGYQNVFFHDAPPKNFSPVVKIYPLMTLESYLIMNPLSLQFIAGTFITKREGEAFDGDCLAVPT